MKRIVVRDIKNVTQISKSNNQVWEALIKLMQNETEDVLFDFEDINLEDPCGNELFRVFIGNPRVNIKLYTAEKTKNTIELMCRLGGIPTGRVINEDEIVETGIKKENKNLIALIKRFKDSVTVVQGTGIIVVEDTVSQIGNNITVDAIEATIREFHTVSGIKRFVVDLGMIFIQLDIIEKIAKMGAAALEDGIDIKLHSEDSDIQGKIGLYKTIANVKKITPAEKFEIFTGMLRPNTVGMLSRFADTKADEFGRRGGGRPIWCRVAIYLGTDEKNNLQFRTYHKNYFYTPFQYRLDHDDEELEGLVSDEVKIPITQVGLADKFLGTLFHFNLPIQYKPQDYFTINVYDEEEDTFNTAKVTTPEYIKVVLDSHKVPYDAAALMNAIVVTKRILEKVADSKQTS